MSTPNSRALVAIAAATFLTLVPITLLVPGLNELVVDAHGGTQFQAQLFVSLNQLAGVVAVEVVKKKMKGKRKNLRPKKGARFFLHF